MPLKTCNKCGKQLGVRTKECSCGFVFKPKEKVKLDKEIHWRVLSKGDKIKSVIGYGPYYTKSDGSKEYMGEYGVFTVDNVDDKGINAFSPHGSHVYLYMGSPSVSKTGTILESHKIHKIT